MDLLEVSSRKYHVTYLDKRIKQYLVTNCTQGFLYLKHALTIIDQSLPVFHDSANSWDVSALKKLKSSSTGSASNAIYVYMHVNCKGYL